VSSSQASELARELWQAALAAASLAAASYLRTALSGADLVQLETHAGSVRFALAGGVSGVVTVTEGCAAGVELTGLSFNQASTVVREAQAYGQQDDDDEVDVHVLPGQLAEGAAWSDDSDWIHVTRQRAAGYRVVADDCSVDCARHLLGLVAAAPAAP
jgi:hypothetical protein